jgi:hypothetical protein
LITLKIIGLDNNGRSNIKKYYEHYKKVYESLEEIPELTDFDLTIVITSNFFKDLKSHSPEIYSKIKNSIVEISTPDGILIPPNSEELKFTILFKSKIFNNDQYLPVMIHEFTHLFDHVRYIDDYGYIHLKNEIEKGLNFYNEFHNWTEFHSQRNSMVYYISFKFGKEYPKRKHLDDLIQASCEDFKLEILIKKLNEFKRIKSLTDLFDEVFMRVFGDFFQTLMYYYGRASVFQNPNEKDFPDKDFPKELLIQNFGSNIVDIYDLLLDMITYNNAKEKLKEFYELYRNCYVIKYLYLNKEINR